MTKSENKCSRQRKRRWTEPPTPEYLAQCAEMNYWPVGLKADLARITPFPSRDQEYEHVATRDDGPSRKYVISRQMRGQFIRYVRLACYQFDHPRLTYPNPPSWRRRNSFRIDYNTASAWRAGLQRLLQFNPKSDYEFLNFPLFEIQHGFYNDDGTARNHIRFYVARARDGSGLYHVIRSYRKFSQEGRYYRTGKRFADEFDNPSLFRSLDLSLKALEDVALSNVHPPERYIAKISYTRSDDDNNTP